MTTIAILVFLSVFGLIWQGMSIMMADQIILKKRLRDMEMKIAPKNKLGINEELQADFKERILQPIITKIGVWTQKYTPVRQIDYIEKKLDYAGRPFGWTANDYLSAQYVITMATAILALCASWLYGASLLNKIMAFLIGIIVGYLLLELIITSQIGARQKQIEKELPDVLDLLTISIEAGLGFDAAMQRVVQKAQGPIAEEFSQCLQEMRIGKTRREALRDLSLRTGVADLSRFVDALIQADQLGVSLGNVLRSQSDQMRIIRRQRVQEQAMKAPVKMLFPMVVFIFPTIFIVILAPAFMQIVKAL